MRMITGWRTLFLAIGLAAVTGAAVVVAGAFFGRPAGTAAQGEVATAPAADPALLPAPTLDADGLYVAAWYRPSSGDLARDAALAAEEGKILAIFWERKGCPFCALLHNQALRIPALHAYVADRFYAVRLNFHGERAMRDFDGETFTESEVAGRHRAYGTPTLEFRTADGKEVLRIPGYVEPPVLQSAFEYVDTGAYRQTNINAWLKSRDLL